MKKTLTCLILLLCAAALLLCSCTNGKKPPIETDGGSGDASDETLSGLPPMDFGEEGAPREVVLLTFKGYNADYHFFADDMEGNLLHQVAFERTAYVNETYNVSLVAQEYNGTTCDPLFNSEAAGGGDYDFVYPHPDISWTNAIMQGCLTDFRTLEYVDLDAVYWNQSQIEEYTLGGKLFFAVSDFTMDGQGFSAMIFNRKIATDLQFEKSLYDIVRDGEWTMEKMGQMLKLYGNDINEDKANAQYGLVYEYGHTISLHISAGLPLMGVDESGNYYSELINQTEKLNDMAQKLYNLLWNSGDRVFINQSNYGTFSGSEGWTAFLSDRVLFMTYNIGSLYRYLQTYEGDMGFLPLPKFDELQKDYYVSCGSGFLCIPAHAPDAQMSGFLLEALAAYSYSYYRPTFFNNILLGRLSKVQEDYDMLDFLHAHKKYTIGLTFGGGGYQVLRGVVVDNKSTDTMSFVRNNYNMYMMSNTALNELKDFILNMK
ncbi:MAG: hypothetical protein IJZ80_03105 [Clostridia bacterium]|nr:hypothetical protein [Clostridia bacterium]